MSKIRAVRLININYNHDAIRISDETMHFNGESTLISLQNGGGKSVLVQMLCAPFVQKRFRNVKDRPFAGYFRTPQPSFILVEWQLEQGGGCLLTGMMVRRSQDVDAGETLEIVNFLSEYRAPCTEDIHHLPVVEKTRTEVRLKSYAACRQLFETLRRQPQKKFLSYDMNSAAQAKQYFTKLMEYGIDYREWQNIIRKVNEEESGLSKLFSDCKDEKGLVEKWFLDAIESKLNKEQNRMGEFRSILEKYVRLYQGNRSKIERKAKIQHFEEEALKIEERAEAYGRSSAAAAAMRDRLVCYMKEIARLDGQAADESCREAEALDALEGAIREVEYQRYSARHYEEATACEALRQRLRAAQERMAACEEERAAWQKRRQLLQLARQQEGLSKEQAELEKIVQLLDVCRHEERELGPERDYIGYRLRLHYEQQIGAEEQRVRSTEKRLDELSAREAAARQEAEAVEQERVERAQQEGALEAATAAYGRVEDRYAERWQAPLVRNIVGEYESGKLQALAAALDDAAAAAAAKERSKKARQAEVGTEIVRTERAAELQRQQEAEKQAALVRARQILQGYDEELAYRRRALKYLDRSETDAALFDGEGLLAAAAGKLKEMAEILQKLTVEEKKCRDELENLRTGRNISLPPGLRKMFENLGIPLVYGMEWLKRNGLSEEENLSLCEKNPFLPYALILSQAQLQRLQEEPPTVFTAAPVPLVTRESLERGEEPGAQPVGNVHFYMLFNKNLLNEEKLRRLLEEKEAAAARLQKELQERRKEHENYVKLRDKLREQAVTEPLYRAAEKEIEEIEEACAALAAALVQAKADLQALRQEEKTLAEELRALEREAARREQQQRELGELTDAYCRYLEEKARLADCRARLAALEKKKEEVRASLAQLALAVRTEERGREEGLRRLEELQCAHLAFAHYEEAAKPAALKTPVDDFTALLARYQAITEKVSAREQALEAQQKLAAERVRQAQKELQRLARKYEMEPEAWRGVLYSEAEEEQAEREEASCEKKRRDEEREKNAADKEIALAEQRIEQNRREMKRACGKEEPLEREAIPVLDHEARKEELLQQKRRHEKTLAAWQERQRCYDSILTSLAEYEAEEPQKEVAFEEDFAHADAAFLRSFTGRLQQSYRKGCEERTRSREKLTQALNSAARIETFQEDFFKKPLETLLACVEAAEKVLRQLAVIRQSYRDLMAKLLVDIAMVEDEKQQIVALLQEYVREVHAQMGKIDSNSSIRVRDRAIKMLRIELPLWSENESAYRTRIEEKVEALTRRGIDLLEKEDTLHDFIGKRLTTRELYDDVIGIANIHIELFKIEAQRERRITWNEVASNSGGEGFLSAFVILASLLHYMRRDETDIFAERNEGKVLLMDNPFAQTNASHLLKPLMEVAKKNNTQLICLTGLGGESIYNRFDNIYILNLVESRLNRVQYLKSQQLAGKAPDTALSFARIEVADDEAHMESLF